MRIENRIEINAPVDRVYDALTDLDSLPLLIPGIKEAHVTHVKHGLVGTKMDLTTSDGKHLTGEVKQVLPRRNLVFEDARGLREELSLSKTKQGTTEIVEVLTVPESHTQDGMREEAERKLQEFARNVESGP